MRPCNQMNATQFANLDLMFTRKYRTAKTNIGVAVSLGLEPASTIPQGVISEKPQPSPQPC